jgi:PAS domain S-box-containing protein
VNKLELSGIIIKIKNKIYEERYKILIIAVIYVILGFLTYYIHFILKIDIIYTHLFYFPIILTCYWYKKKGLILSAFILGFLVFLPAFIRPSVLNIDNFLRVFIVISVGLFIVFLSEKILNIMDELQENQENLKKLNNELEQKVNKRTKDLRSSKELLKRSYNQLNTIFSNLKDIVFVISKDYKILFKNDSAHSLFEKDIVGKDCYEIIKGQDYPCERCPMKKFMESDVSLARFEQRINTPFKEETKVFDIVSSPLENYGGEPAILEILRDITERKKAEEELRKAKRFSESIIDSLPGIFYFFDEKGKFLRWNNNFEEISEYSAEEISKKNILDFFTGEDKRIIAERIQEVFIKGKSTAEADFISKSGKKTPYYFTGLRIIIGNVPYLGGMGIDITERKKAEQKLIKSEKKYREAYNRAEFYKDLFSHDINNILQSILSGMELSELILENPNNFDDLKTNVRIIKEQVIRGANLSSNVRKLSQLEESEKNLKQIEIYTILKKTILFVKNSYQNKKITIQIDSIGDKHYIQANNFLEDVFENILINAIRHNRKLLVDITVRISRVQKDGVPHLKMEFLDNGIGVDDTRKKKIFERGYTEDRSIHGMGLGLSLVKRIIDIYDGEMRVEDRVKGDHTKGSNFILLIPEGD